MERGGGKAGIVRGGRHISHSSRHMDDRIVALFPTPENSWVSMGTFFYSTPILCPPVPSHASYCIPSSSSLPRLFSQVRNSFANFLTGLNIGPDRTANWAKGTNNDDTSMGREGEKNNNQGAIAQRTEWPCEKKFYSSVQGQQNPSFSTKETEFWNRLNRRSVEDPPLK